MKRPQNSIVSHTGDDDAHSNIAISNSKRRCTGAKMSAMNALLHVAALSGDPVSTIKQREDGDRPRNQQQQRMTDVPCIELNTTGSTSSSSSTGVNSDDEREEEKKANRTTLSVPTNIALRPPPDMVAVCIKVKDRNIPKWFDVGGGRPLPPPPRLPNPQEAFSAAAAIQAKG